MAERTERSGPPIKVVLLPKRSEIQAAGMLNNNRLKPITEIAKPKSAADKPRSRANMGITILEWCSILATLNCEIRLRQCSGAR